MFGLRWEADIEAIRAYVGDVQKQTLLLPHFGKYDFRLRKTSNLDVGGRRRQ